MCRNCHNLYTLKIPPAEFDKNRLLGAAAEAKFVREHNKIALSVKC
jgi:arginyl-tRNA--protein-N-Asp/Glu arginylyltransferase